MWGKYCLSVLSHTLEKMRWGKCQKRKQKNSSDQLHSVILVLVNQNRKVTKLKGNFIPINWKSNAWPDGMAFKYTGRPFAMEENYPYSLLIEENKNKPRMIFSTVARLTESHHSIETCIPRAPTCNDFITSSIIRLYLPKEISDIPQTPVQQQELYRLLLVLMCVWKSDPN